MAQPANSAISSPPTGMKKVATIKSSRPNTVLSANCGTKPSGEGHLRICFGAEPYERLEEAMDRIERYLERLTASGI